MRKFVIIAALAASAALAPAAPAAQPDLPEVSLKDICVMTWHHIGEVCVSQVDDIAKAKANCLATAEDKVACARIPGFIDPNATGSQRDAACIQIYLGYHGCIGDAPCWARAQAGEVPVVGDGPTLYCTAR
jgi:hypothetical protein